MFKTIDLKCFFCDDIRNMETSFLSRSFLETLSSSDLISLADDYGIDIPDDLNRRFIIGELLEAAEEMKQDTKKSEMVIKHELAETNQETVLPGSYNETNIYMILRNPVWAFVWWDIKKSDLSKMHSEGISSLMLHVSLFNEDQTLRPEVFDVQISSTDREQYILLPAGYKFVRIDLLSSGRTNKTLQTLACSRCVEIPQGCKELQNLHPGCKITLSPILKLSGMENLLRKHYAYHRQSFS